MITLARFDAPEDAYLFKAFLGSEGISSSVLDEHVCQLFWQYRLASGGTRVVLDDADQLPEAEVAHRTYFENLNQGPPLVTEVRWWPLILLLSWAIGGPFLVFGRRNTDDKSKSVTPEDEKRAPPVG